MTLFRTGNHNPRNIYRRGINRDTDEHVAVAFAPEFARFIVRSLNSYLHHNRAYDALARIAVAHKQTVDAMGGVSGYCCECDQVWPCPTRRWSTLSVRDPDTAAWDDTDEDANERAASADADAEDHLGQHASTVTENT